MSPAAKKKGGGRRGESPVDRFHELFEALARDEKARAVVKKARFRLLLELTEPEGAILVDGRVDPFAVERDPAVKGAELTLRMSCATADRFFLGTLELMKAIASGDIASEGSLFRMLELRPMLDRARETYRQIR